MIQRRFPVGAEITREGVNFRVWAPGRSRVTVQLQNKTSGELVAENNGYFSATVAEAVAGDLYRYQLDGETVCPDPVSRFQPQGPHGPSQIIDPAAFEWSDNDWRISSLSGQVIYEMHIGTFTSEGTWQAACGRLQELKHIGITLLEIMPVAEFPGRFGWGYDGVDLFAPSHLYGKPDDFRTFINTAHRIGLGVILDVVYNHTGPDGCYLKAFSPYYFTDRYKNEWGQAINFDGEHSSAVREFVITNACYWVSEYHLDGLRLDATQQMYDLSAEHIMAELTRQARKAAGDRRVLIIGENESQHARLVRTPELGGYGLDALWNDDFHHSARVAATGRREAYYSDYRGTAQELVAAVRHGFLYQGQYYSWQNNGRGSAALDLPGPAFILYLQNHDQISNSAYGLRLHQLTSPGIYRALTALLLLAPATPLLFQGQEYGATTPFLYFADHTPELAAQVATGRREFLFQFPGIAFGFTGHTLDAPHDPATFNRCKLVPSTDHNPAVLALHRDLLHLRRVDPVFSSRRADRLDGAVLTEHAFVLRFLGEVDDRLLVVNLGTDLSSPAYAEPLMAPPEGQSWTLIWSSEDRAYGGYAAPPINTAGVWSIPGQSASVLKSMPT